MAQPFVGVGPYLDRQAAGFPDPGQARALITDTPLLHRVADMLGQASLQRLDVALATYNEAVRVDQYLQAAARASSAMLRDVGRDLGVETPARKRGDVPAAVDSLS